MATRVRIVFEEAEISAILDASSTAQAVVDSLPLSAQLSTWGEEIYFTVPVLVGEAPEARQDMAVGELGYWPVGAAFCIFFGPTPASEGPTPRAYSNVNPFGRLEGRPSEWLGVLRSVRDGDTVRVEPA